MKTFINLLRNSITLSCARSILTYQARYVTVFAARLLVLEPLATVTGDFQ
jgi:hypothetical protein